MKPDAVPAAFPPPLKRKAWGGGGGASTTYLPSPRPLALVTSKGAGALLHTCDRTTTTCIH